MPSQLAGLTLLALIPIAMPQALRGTPHLRRVGDDVAPWSLWFIVAVAGGSILLLVIGLVLWRRCRNRPNSVALKGVVPSSPSSQRISKEEWLQKHGSLAQFEAMDVNGDGFVDEDEFGAWLDRNGMRVYEQKLRDVVGITDVRDLPFVQAKDLEGIGMSRPKQKRFLHEARGALGEEDPISPHPDKAEEEETQS